MMGLMDVSQARFETALLWLDRAEQHCAPTSSLLPRC